MTNWRSAEADASPLEVVKVSLTTIGGIGGTGYLVIKYRERASAERAERDAEQVRAEQGLLSGVQQLGSESPQVRIAGVYALADVADTYRSDYRQRVVNILCGYLRTPRGTWQTNAKDDDPASDKTYMSNDGAVESTVLEVLSRHLRKRREKTDAHGAVIQDVDDDQLWCDCTIDLHDAVITEPLSFAGVTLASDVTFWGATFQRDAIFWRATFNASTIFWGATFNADTFFWDATFNADVTFRDTTYNDYVDFRGATFTNLALFEGATLIRYANFQGAIFNQSAPPIGFPREIVDHDTDLPKGARWAWFNDEGEVIEEDSGSS